MSSKPAPAEPVAELDLPGEKLTEAPIKIGGEWYVLRELNGPSLAEWMKYTNVTMKRDEQGNVSREANFDDWAQTLVGLCLFKGKVDGKAVVIEGKVLGKAWVTSKAWGSATLNPLFAKARLVSGLDVDVSKKG